MAKKYIVDLNEDEVSQLQSIIKKGKHKARTITRANILLLASEGESDEANASSIRVHTATVQRIREKFVIGGLYFALNDGSFYTTRSPENYSEIRISLYS